MQSQRSNAGSKARAAQAKHLNRINAIQDSISKKIIVQVPYPDLENVALEGGGVRGTGYAGFRKKAEEYGVFDTIEALSGSSAGAIAALIFALGYTADEAYQELFNLNIEDFLENSKPGAWTPEFIANIKNFFTIILKENHALSSGRKFLAWLEGLVERKLGNRKATFGDLQKRIEEDVRKQGKSDFKFLYVTATELSSQQPVAKTFSHETDKDMPLALGTYASAAFPLVFEPALWKGLRYADGGLMNNLPYKKFDEEDKKDEEFKNKKHNPKTLIVKIDTLDEIAQLIWGVKKKVDIKTIREVLMQIYNAATQTVDADEIRESRLVLPLPDCNIQTLEFGINDANKSAFIAKTEAVTEEFFQNFYSAAYEVYVYDDVESWLASLEVDLNKLKQVRLAYQIMLIDSIKQSNHSDEYESSNKDSPTKEELEKQIELINRHIRYINNKELGHLIDQQELNIIDANKLWLEQSSLDSINDFINILNSMLLTDDEETILHQLSVENLKDQISFLNRYVEHKTSGYVYEGSIPTSFNWKIFLQKPHYPIKHINIKPKIADNDWNQKVKKQMEIKLKDAKFHRELKEKDKDYFNNLLSVIRADYENSRPSLPIKKSIQTKQVTKSELDSTELKDFQKPILDKTIASKLHMGPFDSLLEYVGYHESIKLLEAEIKDLENKLGITEKTLLTDEEKRLLKEKNESHSKEMNTFYDKLQTIFHKQHGNPSMRAILSNVNLFDPLLKFKSPLPDVNIHFLFDLTNAQDRQLFLLASLLYLQYKNYKQGVSEFLDLYYLLYPAAIKEVKAELIPTSMKKLGHLLNQHDHHLLISAYKIEELMHLFEMSQTPKEKPSIDIDTIFQTTSISFYKLKEQMEHKEKASKKAGIGLQNIFSTRTSGEFEEPKPKTNWLGKFGKRNQ